MDNVVRPRRTPTNTAEADPAAWIPPADPHPRRNHVNASGRRVGRFGRAWRGTPRRSVVFRLEQQWHGLGIGGRPRRAQWSGPPFDASISRVVYSVRQLLVRWRLPADVIDDAVLVVAELLANVVEHAQTPFRVVAELLARTLYLAVEDGAVGRAPAGPGCASPGYLSGLRVVNAVALRWGWQQHKTGNTVWAEVLT